MLKTMGIVMAVALALGCEGDPPTCQDSLTSFYAAGCTLTTANGAAFTLQDSIANCRNALAEVPASCEGPFGDLRSCWADAETNAHCTRCDAEVEALYTCE